MLNKQCSTIGAISILLLILSALGLGIFAFTRPQRVVVTPPKQKEDLIHVFTPKLNADVPSSFEVTGEAKGEWFFEASFPVRLLDTQGNVVAHSTAAADGDWMTETFVPFHATLSYPTPKNAENLTLVLENDNPSGLPANAKSVEVPLHFTDNYQWVKVFFQNGKLNPNINPCDKVFSVLRPVPKNEKAIARAALGHLLGGPDEVELGQGYYSAIPLDAGINKLTISNGIAYADFDDKFNFQVGGACQITTIRAQVEETLKQFPTVKKVVISVNGQTESILEP